LLNEWENKVFKRAVFIFPVLAIIEVFALFPFFLECLAILLGLFEMLINKLNSLELFLIDSFRCFFSQNRLPWQM
jgi:hypothetical protein